MAPEQKAKELSATAAETIAISESAIEKAEKLLESIKQTHDDSGVYLKQVPQALATAFNARFSGFWADQMHDSEDEAERQICGWLDMYARGIFLDRERFTASLARSEYVPLVVRHLDELSKDV